MKKLPSNLCTRMIMTRLNLENFILGNWHSSLEVVVAQLAGRSDSTPEIHSLNPVIGKFYFLSIILEPII